MSFARHARLLLRDVLHVAALQPGYSRSDGPHTTPSRKQRQYFDVRGDSNVSRIFPGDFYGCKACKRTLQAAILRSGEGSRTMAEVGLNLCGRLAQRLERPVYTRKVECSNHSLPTTLRLR